MSVNGRRAQTVAHSPRHKRQRRFSRRATSPDVWTTIERGALLGLACGDALGRPVEFTTPAEITPEYGRLDEMVGHGTWNQPAGTITDDAEQALCLARSLTERQSFDPADIAERFVAWYDSKPFDIGRMTMKSLSRLKWQAWHEAGLEVGRRIRRGATPATGA